MACSAGCTVSLNPLQTALLDDTWDAFITLSWLQARICASSVCFSGETSTHRRDVACSAWCMISVRVHFGSMEPEIQLINILPELANAGPVTDTECHSARCSLQAAGTEHICEPRCKALSLQIFITSLYLVLYQFGAKHGCHACHTPNQRRSRDRARFGFCGPDQNDASGACTPCLTLLPGPVRSSRAQRGADHHAHIERQTCPHNHSCKCGPPG